MGNAGCKSMNTPRKASSAISKTDNPISKAIKGFLNCPANPTKVQEKKRSAISCIERSSRINRLMNGGEILTLSQEILSSFSNAEIAKVNNETVYISILLPNFFEPSSEPRLNSSHNVNVSSVQSNWPLYFTTNTVDKINEIFNLNNDTSEKTNRYKMSMHSVNSTYRDILGLSIHNLNMSRDSLLESEPNHTISRMNTKKSRLTAVFSKRSSKEVAITEEDETSFNFARPKKGSSKSVKFVNMQTDNSQYKRGASLIPVKEFEVDLPEREDYEDSSDKSFRSELDRKKMKKMTGKLFPVKRRNISDSRIKKISYSLALRKKIQTSVKNLKKIESAKSATRSPFDLFSDKVLEHFKNEENVVEHSSKKTQASNAVNPVTPILIHKPVPGIKKQQKSKKQDLHFSINLKVIIKQEIKANLNSNGRVNYNHVNHFNNYNCNSDNPYSNHFTNLKKKDNFNSNSVNNSTLFKDSIDKYVHFENSLFNTAAQKGQSNSGKKNKRGFYTSAAKLTNQKNNLDKLTPSIDMLSKISISNFEEKDNNQNSNFQDNSEETINKDLELLKK